MTTLSGKVDKMSQSADNKDKANSEHRLIDGDQLIKKDLRSMVGNQQPEK